MDIAQRPFCVEIYRKNAGRARAHLDQTRALFTLTVRTPSVWPHCLGKDGCLVLSIHSGIGAGTVLSQKLGSVRGNAHERDDPQRNFAGHAFETRFMLAALLRVSCLTSQVLGHPAFTNK